MSSFFIATEISDNKFVGVVYNKNTNTKVYQTQKHAVQQDALNEANMFLRTNSSTPQTPTAPSTTQQPKRCCGR